MKTFLASVGNAKLLGKVNGELTKIADVRTLSESTLSFSNTMEEVRAGQGAQLFGRFAHDSGMTANLTEVMWNLDYITYQVGATALTNPSFLHSQGPIKLSSTTQTINLERTAKPVGSACGLEDVIVWTKKSDCKNPGDYIAHILDDESGSITLTGTEGYEVGDQICLEYFITNPNARGIKVGANFIPAELVLILTTQLFAGDASAPETGKPVGSVTVKIPRFSLDGTFDLSMAMSSAATISLQGTALASEGNDCDGVGIYAEIVEYIEDTEGFIKNVKEIIVDDESVEANEIPDVYALFSDGHISKIDADYFTVATNDGVSSTDELSSGANYITVSDDGTAYSTNGSTVLPSNYNKGYKIETVTVSQ